MTLLLPGHGSRATETSSGLGVLAANDAMRARPDAHAALDGLPRLDGGDVDDDAAESDAPFPGDSAVLEHLLIDDWNVDNGEHDEQASDDGEEEEAVAPESRDNGESLWRAVRRVGIHVEEGAGKVLDFPCGDEQQQCDCRVCGCARPEHHVAGVVVAFVTARAEVASAGTDVGDNGKGKETQGAHEEAVDELVGYELCAEDTLLIVVWWSEHAVFLGLFETETDGKEGRRDEVNP